jgi:early secretory antigenic target protein ESAT-6
VSEVKVTFGELAAAEGNITSTSQKITSELDQLKTFVQRLVGQWDGTAREAYFAQQNKLDQAAADLNQVLASVGIAVRQANESYQAAERANTGRFS